MIELVQGDILKANVEALVNVVNCVGVAGKGLALQFRNAYPDNYKAYRNACDTNYIKPGKVFTFVYKLESTRYIINFPTKRHWKDNSRIEDIELGLQDLVKVVQQYQIKSIAIPPLGCGLGGLSWHKVKPLIVEAFQELPTVQVQLYIPFTPDDKVAA